MASIELDALEVTVILSVVSNTILWSPPIATKLRPAGIGAFLTMWLVSKVDGSDQAITDRENFRVMEEA